MARIRTLKPEFWQDEKLAGMSALTRLVFLGLISQADDAGRLVDNVKLLDGLLFPETEDSCREALVELAAVDRILRYQSGSGQKLIQITHWKKHQRVDHASRHVLPAPEGFEEEGEDDEEDSGESRESVAKPSRSDRGPTTSTGGSGSSTSTPNRTTTTRAGGNEPEDDDVNASEARCAMWAEFEDRLTDEPELSEAAHRKATAAVEGIINGEARTAWLDPRGMPVPWTDRPRLFKLALAERIASGGNLHNILRGLIIPREYDPFPVKQSTDPKPGSEAERVKQTPGAETPGRGRGRTTAEQDTAPRQYIPSAEDEAARKQRREQEEAEQRQREDSLIRGWEMQDEVTAKRVRAEAALAVGENKFVPAHLKERATVEEYRQRVLAILKHDGDEAAA